MRCNCTAATAPRASSRWKSCCAICVHQILEGTNEVMRVIVSRYLLGSTRSCADAHRGFQQEHQDMTTHDDSAPVLFEERSAAGGRRTASPR